MFRKTALAVLLIAVMAVPAMAAPVTVPCPLSDVGRQFWLTTDPLGATCLASGSGNLSGVAGNDYLIDTLGWMALDKDETPDTVFPYDAWFSVTNIGGTSGTFTVDPAAWAAFGSLAIGFKVGSAQINPDWAAFILPYGETTGTWSVTVPPLMANQGLSHANLYATDPIPEPATLVLLGSGLLGLAARARRRQKK